jgi:hypothetical protein
MKIDATIRDTKDGRQVITYPISTHEEVIIPIIVSQKYYTGPPLDDGEGENLFQLMADHSFWMAAKQMADIICGQLGVREETKDLNTK